MQPANAVTIPTTQQGVHQLKTRNGKLIVVGGSFQDTTTYKRSLTFYVEAKPGAEWLHVPVVTSPADHELTWFSVSRGDDTIEDALVTTQGDEVFLIIAEKKPAGVVASWYRFSEAGPDDIDGPAYLFKRTGAREYAKNTRPTVDGVLKQEARMPAKR